MCIKKLLLLKKIKLFHPQTVYLLVTISVFMYYLSQIFYAYIMLIIFSLLRKVDLVNYFTIFGLFIWFVFDLVDISRSFSWIYPKRQPMVLVLVLVRYRTYDSIKSNLNSRTIRIFAISYPERLLRTPTYLCTYVDT